LDVEKGRDKMKMSVFRLFVKNWVQAQPATFDSANNNNKENKL